MLESRSRAEKTQILTNFPVNSEILPSSGWALGQVTCARMAKNLISLVMSLTKNQNIFFHCKLEDLPKSQGLNSSLVQSAEELCGWLSQPTYPSFFPDLQVQYIHTPATNMLRLLFSRV